MDVIKLSPDIIGQYIDGGVDFPVIVYGGVENRSVLGVGGLCWTDGQCFAWLDVFGDMSAHSLVLFRQARRMLKVARQLGETEVFVYRDEHPNSAKLLAMLGFEPAGFHEAIGKEIFRCQV